MMLFIRASLLSSYGKNTAKPGYDPKKKQFAKYCHTPLNIRVHLVFWWISSKRHFGALTLKFFLNPITKETMTNLQNTVTRLLFTVFRSSVFTNRVSKILKSLLWNFFLTNLRLIRWPVCKLLSHASESLICATPIVLTIRTTLWSSYREIVT